MFSLLAIKSFLSSYWTWLVAFIVACSVCFLVGYLNGKYGERDRCNAQRLLANVKALETIATANDIAAEERLSDALEANEDEKELVNAIAQVPDGRPDAVRVKLGCERLRKQGTDTRSIPACR